MNSVTIPDLRLHYLGHASFILSFDNGVDLLTDYGQSYAYGLDSPVYDVGHFQPTVVTYSHHHADHDRGHVFSSAQILNGEDWTLKGLNLQAIPVSENQIADNYGYWITYKGFTIFHAGDAQQDIVEIQTQAARRRIREHVPDKVDLLLVPIGWTQDIVEFAAQYVDFLQPCRVIPMHYWSADEKQRFLTHLRTVDEKYLVVDQGKARYEIFFSTPVVPIEVISLTPGPYGA
jgi:L-ascorbate metabolism protein UlaG (beta-lactamase superfamily)